MCQFWFDRLLFLRTVPCVRLVGRSSWKIEWTFDRRCSPLFWKFVEKLVHLCFHWENFGNATRNWTLTNFSANKNFFSLWNKIPDESASSYDEITWLICSKTRRILMVSFSCFIPEEILVSVVSFSWCDVSALILSEMSITCVYLRDLGVKVSCNGLAFICRVVMHFEVGIAYLAANVWYQWGCRIVCSGRSLI